MNEIFDLGGFVGTIGSKTTYSLEPDVPGSDTALVDFSDLTKGDYEGAGTGARCEGQWNATHPRGPRWWSHTERPQYRETDLSLFF